MRSMRPLVAALALLAACGTARDALAPPPSPFLGVRSVALVRSVDVRTTRAKDPLDGLEETLRARGFTTRVVELGARPPPELAAVERLFEQLGLRAAAGRRERIATPLSSVGADAAAAVAQLGVDAVASYHRVDRRRAGLPPGAAPGTFPAPGSAFPGQAPADPDRPVGALVLVDREGRVATFAWGDGDALEDPAVPLNAAEAIDMLVRALTGELPDER